MKSNKSRSANKYTIFKAKNETKPYNLLSEQQKISEGGKVGFLKIDRSVFVKTEKEREELKTLRARTYPRLVGGLPLLYKNTIPKRTTIHLINTRKEKDFKTTHFMMSKNPILDAKLLAESLGETVSSVNVNGKVTIMNNG